MMVPLPALRSTKKRIGKKTILRSAIEAEAYGKSNDFFNAILLSLQLNLRAMISWFISNQYNVAMVNELQFKDTKI
ncbi:hypothetical protein M501DRAFT_996817, partial [Patellaria atrata CBS 101060]